MKIRISFCYWIGTEFPEKSFILQSSINSITSNMTGYASLFPPSCQLLLFTLLFQKDLTNSLRQKPAFSLKLNILWFHSQKEIWIYPFISAIFAFDNSLKFHHSIPLAFFEFYIAFKCKVSCLYLCSLLFKSPRGGFPKNYNQKEDKNRGRV